MSPDEIVSEYPTIALSDVHAALAYYHDHQEEIRGYLREADELFAELKAKQPSLIDKIKARRDATP